LIWTHVCVISVDLNSCMCYFGWFEPMYVLFRLIWTHVCHELLCYVETRLIILHIMSRWNSVNYIAYYVMLKLSLYCILCYGGNLTPNKGGGNFTHLALQPNTEWNGSTPAHSPTKQKIEPFHSTWLPNQTDPKWAGRNEPGARDCSAHARLTWRGWAVPRQHPTDPTSVHPERNFDVFFIRMSTMQMPCGSGPWLFHVWTFGD
jgi:hypothetical protein